MLTFTAEAGRKGGERDGNTAPNSAKMGGSAMGSSNLLTIHEERDQR
jgi:hypothetical protein